MSMWKQSLRLSDDNRNTACLSQAGDQQVSRTEQLTQQILMIQDNEKFVLLSCCYLPKENRCNKRTFFWAEYLDLRGRKWRQAR